MIKNIIKIFIPVYMIIVILNMASCTMENEYDNIENAVERDIQVAHHTIATGSWSTAVITDDGSLWTWGENGRFGLGLHLGNGTTEGSLLPVKIMDNAVSVSSDNLAMVQKQAVIRL